MKKMFFATSLLVIFATNALAQVPDLRKAKAFEIDVTEHTYISKVETIAHTDKFKTGETVYKLPDGSCFHEVKELKMLKKDVNTGIEYPLIKKKVNPVDCLKLLPNNRRTELD